ncbi:hypothetical protein HMPREF1982_04589 [Clostridiales bacterium oral taxon 876 str. F0540]|nr:hypothetical protein HMPREF1982_04589 [Clostridiales bacterium oral taxon 876 str. F0540]
MNKTKKTTALIVSSIIVLSLAGCSRTVTGSKESDNGLKAFNEIVKAYPQNRGFHNALQHWGFKLPTGEKFEWTKDMSANKADFAMVMLADPLVKAGLDVNKLDKNEWLYSPAAKEEGQDLPNRLVKPYNVSDKKVKSTGSEDAFRRILKADPSLIKYHEQQKHYRLILGDGNEVQWTEKLGLNDADITFILKAEPLIKAGLDINKLEGTGWIFKKAGKDDMGENPDQIVKSYKISK